MLLLLKNALFIVVVPGTVAVYVPRLIVQGRPIATGLMLVAALLVLIAGLAIFAWCVWDFATFGRGTPAPIDAPKRLVVRGLYCWVRNPMYVGVLGVLVGQALLFGSGALALYAVFVGTCFHLFTVRYEEPHLREVFGPEYEAYQAQVPRWLPRFPGAPPERMGSR